MKNVIALCAILILSMPVMAQETQNTQDTKKTEQWMCSGYGIINMGGPGGVITVPFQGRGNTEFEAMSNAQQNCRSQGLQQCFVNSCYKR